MHYVEYDSQVLHCEAQTRGEHSPSVDSERSYLKGSQEHIGGSMRPSAQVKHELAAISQEAHLR